MAHFRLIRTDDIHNGPVDYSTPIGESEVYRCSRSANAALDAQKPAGRRFACNIRHDAFWFKKFVEHTGQHPDQVTFARTERGWYAEAMYL